MKRIYYNKLIRDKIPEKIKKSGGDFKIKKLKVKEFEKELIKKVGEESDGLLAAKTKKKLISELADVLDVIQEIKRFKGITSQQIKRAQKESNKKKGGFKKRLFLFWSSDTGYKTNERRYKNY
ncbi:MAG TPA: phosphoribosyl-ATP pyrophosphohydrolase [Candidatus Nealsonbacteria bacterium]|uniref:Phosphoribosyl-ATP pyrophosphohydrolase n=1 Tax=marine sediment metagenome TaxID=412755 RepID=A0A0F9VCB0_9ZZZZ|nr:phosphoribosyl-ATP pyrophosphohydrolase [Candidatus Nealsonbacteria bacterium]HEB46807.1 phosphoribosyl-ATP pyrophosphohydrolase [Candidatus Nealsonbacteria bacterium]